MLKIATKDRLKQTEMTKSSKREQRSEDRRVTYTRKLLQTALLDLMRERPVNRITTTDLCRKAQVNRNTFYSHYRTPEDVLYELEGVLLTQISTSLEELGKTSRQAAMEHILDEIRSNRAYFEVLLSPFGNKEFLRRLVELSLLGHAEQWQLSDPSLMSRRQRQTSTFITNGAIAVIQQWVQDGMSQSNTSLADHLVRLGDACIGAAEAQNARYEE